MLGQGWIAEDWLTFHRQGGFPWPERPELAGAGHIAYLGRNGNVWLMKADGSARRVLVSASAEDEGFGFLAWSPSGHGLSFTVSSWSQDGGSKEATRIVDLAGGIVAEYPDLVAALWSPHGGRLSGLRVHARGEMMGYQATPVVIDLATGAESPVGPRAAYHTAPVWNPAGTSLAFVCTSTTAREYASDGSAAEEVLMDCEGDGLRVVAADGTGPRVIMPFSPEEGVYFHNPSWRPNGDVIALSSRSDSGDCRGYLLVDAQTGNRISCFPLPPPSGYGGRCGFYEDGATDWSTDGRHLIHHWEFGAGRNGVWIVDVVSGEEILVPTIPASFVSVASDGQHLTFGSAGHIWVVGMDGSNLTLLAQGSQPAWQPQS
jgi:hypothetical protein